MILIILLGALFLRFNKVNVLFPFDFDQVAPANTAYELIKNHKISLIGQELSFPGFFIGPIYNWTQILPYWFCDLRPDCIPYFLIIFGFVSTSLTWFIFKKIFDNKTAIIASTIYGVSFASISQEIGVNGNSYLYLFSILIFFCLYKYFKNNDKYLVLGAFVAGLATVNFNPIYIFSVFAFFTTSLIRKNKNYIVFLIAASAFLINYLPLVIFNYRHNSILLNGIRNFASQNRNDTYITNNFLFLINDVIPKYYSNYFYQSANFFFILFTLILLLLGLYFLLKTKQKFLLFLPIWIAAPIFGLSIYKGHIPDYYFQQTLLAVIILTSYALRQNIVIFTFFLAIFLYTNISANVNYKSIINYRIKNAVVNYVISDVGSETFNVYYALPPGLNTGYDYLFKISGRLPQDGSPNLYILEFVDPIKFKGYKYQIAFPTKQIKTKVIGFVHVISVK